MIAFLPLVLLSLASTHSPQLGLGAASTVHQLGTGGTGGGPCTGPFLFDRDVTLLGKQVNRAWADLACGVGLPGSGPYADVDETPDGHYELQVNPQVDDPGSCSHFVSYDRPFYRQAHVSLDPPTLASSYLSGTYFTYADLAADRIHGELSISGGHHADAIAFEIQKGLGVCVSAGTDWSVRSTQTMLPGFSPTATHPSMVKVEFRTEEATTVRVRAQLGAWDSAAGDVAALAHLDVWSRGRVILLRKAALGQSSQLVYFASMDLDELDLHSEESQDLALSPGEYVLLVFWSASSSIAVEAKSWENPPIDSDGHNTQFHHYCSGTVTTVVPSPGPGNGR